LEYDVRPLVWVRETRFVMISYKDTEDIILGCELLGWMLWSWVLSVKRPDDNNSKITITVTLITREDFMIRVNWKLEPHSEISWWWWCFGFMRIIALIFLIFIALMILKRLSLSSRSVQCTYSLWLLFCTALLISLTEISAEEEMMSSSDGKI
jgi:hypothetical protein